MNDEITAQENNKPLANNTKFDMNYIMRSLMRDYYFVI